MSHFFTFVVLPKDCDGSVGVESEVERLLAPYNEQIEVAPHKEKCYCVGRKAQTECVKQVESIDSLRERFATEYPELAKASPFDDEVSAIWRGKFVEPRQKMIDELLEKHPYKDLPDPECSECKGTGVYLSTYNPNSKWDWWVIGGRWDDGEERNVTTVDEILENGICPFAVVLPDGTWHERGQMGWWACVSNEKADVCWESEFRELIESYKGHTAVTCDLHI